MKLSHVAYLLVTALILSLVMATAAFGQPPDEIPNSLIPPLKEKPARTAGRAAPVVRVADATANNATTLAKDVTTNGRPVPAAPVTSAPNGAAGPYAKDPDAPNDYDARLAIWNSPEMVDARRYVLEYSQRSARSSLKEGEQFLARVSQLSPSEMKAWLERLQARRAAIARQQEVTSAARQFSLEQAAQRQQQSRQAHANINQWQSLSAIYLQDRLQTQQLATRQQQSLREFGRTNAIASQRIWFDPFAPTLDPASPPAATRYRAAASLPGDLPRSDPRNFIRGEEGIDTGENGVAQSGGPAPAAAPSPAPEAPSAPPSGE
ncbi:MAG: hypothetical protein H0T51_07290 [Pirellulales bacterium]|nr:hypothetical protein [Pirellulales bacterium]